MDTASHRTELIERLYERAKDLPLPERNTSRERRGSMPYNSIQELPESVREHLPEHAQQIYQAAYNSAWNEYREPSKRRGEETREEAAHKVAWTAVKDKYQKDERTGQWKLKPEQSMMPQRPTRSSQVDAADQNQYGGGISQIAPEERQNANQDAGQGMGQGMTGDQSLTPDTRQGGI